MIYRAPRAIVYACKGNKGEVKRSGAFDLAEEINPIKKVYNIGKAIASLGFKHKTGIWLGTRPLASGFAFIETSFSPGFDLRHYCLMCNGVIYHLNGIGMGKSSKIEIKPADGNEGF